MVKDQLHGRKLSGEVELAERVDKVRYAAPTLPGTSPPCPYHSLIREHTSTLHPIPTMHSYRSTSPRSAPSLPRPSASFRPCLVLTPPNPHLAPSLLCPVLTSPRPYLAPFLSCPVLISPRHHLALTSPVLTSPRPYLTSPHLCLTLTSPRSIKGWMTRQIFFGLSESVCLKTYLSRIKVHTEQGM